MKALPEILFEADCNLHPSRVEEKLLLSKLVSCLLLETSAVCKLHRDSFIDFSVLFLQSK